SLVGEFQPFTGSWPAFIIMAVVLAWRKRAGRSLLALVRDPVFCMAGVGLILGLRVLRFWLDWGIPALTLWLAGEFAEFFESSFGREKLIRLAGTGVVGVGVMTNPGGGRGGPWGHDWGFLGLGAARPPHPPLASATGGCLFFVGL